MAPGAALCKGTAAGASTRADVGIEPTFPVRTRRFWGATRLRGRDEAEVGLGKESDNPRKNTPQRQTSQARSWYSSYHAI